MFTQLVNAPTTITPEVYELWEWRSDDGLAFTIGADDSATCANAATAADLRVIDADDGNVLAIDAEGRTILIVDLGGPFGCYVD